MAEEIIEEKRDKYIEMMPAISLEKALIQQYLQDKGYTLSDLKVLPEQESRQLMKEASMYASVKLAEVEKRSQFVRDIHYLA